MLAPPGAVKHKILTTEYVKSALTESSGLLCWRTTQCVIIENKGNCSTDANINQNEQIFNRKDAEDAKKDNDLNFACFVLLRFIVIYHQKCSSYLMD
ncbi:MAG: hypothetical protein D6737_16095 [Chloroflexi bacterium]|nr:MAG: hypothetical protein D6737_16095 [Chloroflexota bacterium]